MNHILINSFYRSSWALSKMEGPENGRTRPDKQTFAASNKCLVVIVFILNLLVQEKKRQFNQRFMDEIRSDHLTVKAHC